MKVKSVIVNGRVDRFSLEVIPMGNRIYKLAKPTYIVVNTDEGRFIFAFDLGFMTNFRSGGLLVDFFLDQIGTSGIQIAYLIHDACYTPCLACKGEHPISRLLADQLLKGLLEYAAMDSVQSWLVYNSVRLFGGSAYNEDDELTAENSKLFTFTWDAT